MTILCDHYLSCKAPPAGARTLLLVNLRHTTSAFGKACELVLGCPTLTIAPMQKKIFWMVFMLLGLVADFLLPFWWACAATIPILFAAWWVAYRSDWF